MATKKLSGGLYFSRGLRETTKRRATRLDENRCGDSNVIRVFVLQAQDGRSEIGSQNPQGRVFCQDSESRAWNEIQERSGSGLQRIHCFLQAQKEEVVLGSPEARARPMAGLQPQASPRSPLEPWNFHFQDCRDQARASTGSIREGVILTSRRFGTLAALGKYLSSPKGPKAFRVVTRRSGGRKYYQVTPSKLNRRS